MAMNATAQLSARSVYVPDKFSHWMLNRVSLDAAGLVALADLTTVARRTVLTGTSCLLDAFVICPGLHRQQNAVELNAGEYPTCADMITQWIFRVENPATVLFLQKVGRTGRVTTLSVSKLPESSRWNRFAKAIYDFEGEAPLVTVAYFLALTLTVVISGLLIWIKDWWALAVIVSLVTARLLNVAVIRRRAEDPWSGSDDTGKRDLLVLVSQDRWIRMKGSTKDVKAVTAGQWLREPTKLEDSATAFATLVVQVSPKYLNATVAGNARQEGKFMLLFLLFGSVFLLGLANSCSEALKLHGRVIRKEGCSQQYYSRTEMANELMKEPQNQGKEIWATRLGIKQPDVGEIMAASGVDATEAAPARTLIRQRTARGGQMV